MTIKEVLKDKYILLDDIINDLEIGKSKKKSVKYKEGVEFSIEVVKAFRDRLLGR